MKKNKKTNKSSAGLQVMDLLDGQVEMIHVQKKQ